MDAAAGRSRPARQPWPDAGVEQSRRRFLYVSAGTAGAGLIAYGGGTLLGENRDVSAAQHALKLPRAVTPAPPLPAGFDLKIPGLSSFITPNSSFYRVDTAIVLPEILPSSWQLRIHGMVEREIVLTFADLIKRPLIEDYITLCCVSNPVGGPYIGNAKWLGGQPAQRAARGRASRPALTSCCARPLTASPRARRCRRQWTAGTPCSRSP